jgi:hypothetical protein
MSNCAVAMPPGRRSQIGRQADFTLSRVDFIFEISISPWKSGPASGFGKSDAKSMR